MQRLTVLASPVPQLSDVQVFVTSKAGEVIAPESVKQVGCVIHHLVPTA